MLGETAVVAFTTFFATLGPISVAVMFAAMTASATVRARRSMAIRGTIIATVILVGFALIGEFLLRSLGISLAALRAAGGILLLLIAHAESDLVRQGVVLAMLLAVLLVTLVCLLLAARIQQWLGVTGMHVITRIFGVLLSALAVQFIFDGIAQSGLIGT